MTGAGRVVELGAPQLGRAERDALAEVIDDGWLTMGDRVARFEREFARLHGAPDAVAVGSATAALQLSLAAFDIGPGDEVLVPSMSFVATAAVVVAQGATPVFVDIESVTRPHISLADARRRIGPRTRAVIVMHFGGNRVDLPAWRALADEHGLLLFEDAAHAAGLDGLGRLGDTASFSFFANKNMTTAEGGMVLVRDGDRRQRLRRLRAHGMTSGTLDRATGRATGYDVVECGFNFRMDELRAALGLVQLPRLAGWNRRRRELALRYRSLLADLPVEVPFSPADPSTGHIMPVLLPEDRDRAAVMATLRAGGVQSSVHYPPIHRFTAFGGDDRRPPGAGTHPPGGVGLPVTEEFGRRELTVPLHPGLLDADVDHVVATLAAALGTRGLGTGGHGTGGHHAVTTASGTRPNPRD